jgi:pyrimidine-nucleoside phosphorylase
VRADRGGYITAIDGRALGLLAMDLGAGRKDRNDILDLGVGIRVHVRVGQRIEKGDAVFTAHAKAGFSLKPEAYLATLSLADSRPAAEPWLLATIGC